MSEIDEIVSHSSIVGESEVEYYPINPVVSGESIQFDIPESFTHMTDPNFILKLVCKVVEGDNTILKDAARVAPVNLTLHALFTDVVLKANNVILNQATGTYPYRAYIETNFTYSSAAKSGAIGIPQMYYKETPGKFHASVAGLNAGFDSRVAKFAKSTPVEMGGRLHCDLFMQNKLIIPGIKFSLTLIPSSTRFHMISGTPAAAEKLVISRIVLKVRRIALSSAALLSLEKSLSAKSFQYPIRHAVVRLAQINPGQTLVSNFVLNNGQIPRIVIVTFQEMSSFQGEYVRNPFNFSAKKCLSAQISVNGRLCPPTPFTPKTSWLEPYMTSLRIARKLYTDSDTGLTFDDFLENGHQILPFDLNPLETGLPPKTNGVVTFSGQWDATSFDEAHVMLFYLLWDNCINIDERRNITLDYIP